MPYKSHKASYDFLRAFADFIIYPLYTALLSDWHVGDSLPLAYLHEHTCELNIGAFLHCKELEDLLRAFGLWYCESWGIGENAKVKADSITQRCFL